MKKRKILYLIPFAALVLSGCTFQEGWQATTGWLNKNVWTPVVEFFEGLFGKKDNKKEEEEDDPKPTPTPTPTNPVHAGTLEDPFDAADATLVASKLEQDTFSSEAYYVKGEVQEITEEFSASYGNYTFTIENGFKGFRMKNGENHDKFNEGDIEVGDTVLMYGRIKRWYETGELDGTQNGNAYVVSVEKPAPTDADLVSLHIEGTPQTRYAPGVAYNHNGLTATAVYDDGVEQDVTGSAVWTISKATAAVGDTTIKITATFKTVSDSIDVEVTVSSDPVHAGTLEDPLDGADACLIASQLQESDKNNKYPSASKYYIKGVVQELLEEFDPQFGNFTFTIENGFEGYRLKNGSGKAAFTSADDLVVGDTVTIYSDVLNFHGTYETNDGYIHSIEKEPVAVESVVLSAPSLEIEKGQSVLVTASVLPAEASQEVTWSVEGELQERSKVGGTVVEYDPETHILKGLDTGVATLIATSVADPSVSASCSIHVGEATKSLDHIEINTDGAKTSYVVGESYSSEGLAVTAVYDDESTEDVTSLGVEWSFNPATASLGDDEVAVTATYEGKEAHAVINVTVAQAKGTASNPYTCAEAKAAVDSGEGITGVYARGIVTRVAYAYSSTNKNMSFYFSDDGKTTFELEAYKLAADSDPNVEVGDNVTVYGNLTLYTSTSTYEFTEGCTLAEHTKPTVSSVQISGTATQTTYAVGDSYNHTGLVATALLDNGVEKDVSSSATWVIDPVTASATDESISVVATYNNVSSEPFIVEVEISSTPVPTLEHQTIQYTGGTTTNMSGSDQASSLGVTDTHIAVVGTKNSGSNNVGLGADGTIRLYKNSATTLTITITGGTIKTIDITFGSSKLDGIAVNGTSVTGATKNGTSSVTVEGTSAALTNPGTSDRTDIARIVVNYTLNS